MAVTLPNCNRDHVEYSVRSRLLSPDELLRLPELSPSNSSLPRALAAVQPPWTGRCLRSRVLADLKTRLQERREASQPPSVSSESSPSRFHATQTIELVTQYVEEVRRSPFASSFTTRLDGPQVDSALRPEGFWHLHQEGCACCRARGPWESYRAHNHENPCWFANVVAIIYHGWIPVFDSIPDPFDCDNSGSIDDAPVGVRAEHSANVAFGAVHPGASNYVSPLINAFRPHEVQEQIQLLQQHGIEVPGGSDIKHDDLNVLIAQHRAAIPALTPIKSRLCIDLSRKINPHLRKWPFSYCSIQDALRLLHPGSYLAKVDLARMFHQLPLHPVIRRFFAYRLDGSVYVCHRTPFGGTSTPAFANMLAGILAMFIAQRLHDSVFITDDSLYEGRSAADCQEALDTALFVLATCGAIVNHSKVGFPAQRMAFLGFIIDTVACNLGIPSPRLMVILHKLDLLLSEQTPLVRDLLSMAGRLQWVSSVFPRGRPYLASLYTLAGPLSNFQRTRWSLRCRSDLQWWRSQLELLTAPDAAPLWLHFSFQPVPQPIRIFSDASGDLSLGFGLVVGSVLIQGRWLSPRHTSSSYLEYVPILHLLREFGSQLRGQVVVCVTDNASNALALTRGSTLAPTCCEIFREIYSLACDFDIILIGDWCPREFLQLPDDISKFVVQA